MLRNPLTRGEWGRNGKHDLDGPNRALPTASGRRMKGFLCCDSVCPPGLPSREAFSAVDKLQQKAFKPYAFLLSHSLNIFSL